ncbi:hypothetical protein Taro_048111 [Colocasia esculenta]|uniref:Uncharacterized protein n=1 Tax=Colocasia esculenta TaxID=4460 RepID=A0A843X252_COLES|nr:hypothetical protein [Colocasia esculenta]
MVASGDFWSGAQIPLRSDSLDYANRWRCHTRSRPVIAIGSRVQLDARSPPQRLPRLRESLAVPTRGPTQSQRSEVVFNSTRDLLPSSDSLDYANHWRCPHAEPTSHSDRKSCSTRREISSLGRGYGCLNIADIVTPSGLFQPLQRKN